MCHNSGTKIRQMIMEVTDKLLLKNYQIPISVEQIQSSFEKQNHLSIAASFVEDTLNANNKRYLLKYDNEILKIFSRDL